MSISFKVGDRVRHRNVGSAHDGVIVELLFDNVQHLVKWKNWAHQGYDQELGSPPENLELFNSPKSKFQVGDKVSHIRIENAQNGTVVDIVPIGQEGNEPFRYRIQWTDFNEAISLDPPEALVLKVKKDEERIKKEREQEVIVI